MYVTNDIAARTCPQTLRQITNPLQLKDKMKDWNLIKELKPDQNTFYNYQSITFKIWLIENIT